jgi:hypothetical protein
MNEREEIMAGSIYKQVRTSAADKLIPLVSNTAVQNSTKSTCKKNGRRALVTSQEWRRWPSALISVPDPSSNASNECVTRCARSRCCTPYVSRSAFALHQDSRGYFGILCNKVLLKVKCHTQVIRILYLARVRLSGGEMFGRQASTCVLACVIAPRSHASRRERCVCVTYQIVPPPHCALESHLFAKS